MWRRGRLRCGCRWPLPGRLPEAIDGAAQRTFKATPGETYTFMVTGETFMKVLNGDHALTVTASDGKAETVHTVRVGDVA